MARLVANATVSGLAAPGIVTRWCSPAMAASHSSHVANLPKAQPLCCPFVGGRAGRAVQSGCEVEVTVEMERERGSHGTN